GKENFNCAQAILKAYQEDFNITDQQILEYKKFGGGKAEGGVCGALFAAKKLIHNEDISNHVEQHFSKAAGAITCREILSLKQLSCHKCVENIAESLDEYLNLISYCFNTTYIKIYVVFFFTYGKLVYFSLLGRKRGISEKWYRYR
ncbi:C-GCAxxG-C-C family protein, partial [Candidatus Jettenia sp. AMX1]|uniref:C-GCAxxG-C-C family protein n=1 Tax=Candidatus Jettenia sp. AMX1 TaxID=2293637 RepID=UPI0025564C4B